MSFLDRVRISVLLPVLFSIVLVILLGWLALSMVSAVGQRQEASMAARTAAAAEYVFIALQNTRRERGPVRTALNADAPSDADFISWVQEKRSASRPAVEAVIAACREIKCADGFDPEDMDAARRELDRLRPIVDKSLKSPLGARPDGIAQTWQGAANVMVKLIERVADGLDASVRMVDPVIAEQIAVKNAAYQMRDAYGLLLTEVGIALNAGEITGERAVKVASLSGKAEAGRSTLEKLLARDGFNPAILKAYQTATMSYGDIQGKQAQVVGALEEGGSPGVTYGDWTQMGDKVLDDLVGVAMTALSETAAHANSRVSDASWKLINAGILLLVAVAIGAGSFLLMRSRVVQPMARITDAMLAVAKGKLDGDVPYSDHTDEIGDLAGALVVFKENAVERARAEKLNQEASAQREARQKLVAELIQEFDASVSGALTTVSAAAVQLEQTARSMTQIAENSAHQSQESLEAAKNTSSNVQTIAAATEEMSSSSAEIGQQVNESARIARQAATEAEQTNTIVDELSVSAQRIGEVVELITSIAAQTNLLALNATIEAARAGEAGKGFAVVAGEVKALATETAKATDEITSQIGAMQTAADSAVGAIQSIRAVIEQVNSIAASVAAAVEEQNAATNEISRNAQVAAEATQHVTDGIHNVTNSASQAGVAGDEVLSAAGSLSQESDGLRRNIETFLERFRAA